MCSRDRVPGRPKVHRAHAVLGSHLLDSRVRVSAVLRYGAVRWRHQGMLHGAYAAGP
jgi:hypothetical protein